MQKIRKVFVNSAHRVSGTSSNAVFQLPIDIECGNDGEICHICLTGISLPHIWYGIQENVNNLLYFREAGTHTEHVIAIPPGSYSSASLANKIQIEMNKVATGGATYTVQFSNNTNKITITQNNGSGFRVYSDHELRNDGTVDGLPIDTPKSINAILNTPPFSGYLASWSSGLVSVNRIHEVYIRSSALAKGYSTIDPRGVRNCLRKLNVDVDFGGIIVTDHSFETADLHQFSGVIRRFDIQITDVNGSILDIGEVPWSFSISIVYGPID